MRKDFEKLFSHLEPPEPPAGLFDRIILAIKQEQELRKTKRLLFGFFSLLIVSSIVAPFSWVLLMEQVESSGILYFVSTAVSNFNVFLTLWQDFGLAILESMPIMGIAVFTVNMALLLFTVRLFLYKRRLLFGYLMQ
ncbi:MAG: hypothetical protein Q8P63_01575 [Candidatus Nealsonbacteria bacterium]|nr:hypothetical protein [Candidatus Nealsonbacteria bacterium]